MQHSLHFVRGEEHVNLQVQADDAHRVDVTVDERHNCVQFECGTREALFELGRSLMEEALFGKGEVEFMPLVADGKLLVVDGVRLGQKSARVFIRYPKTGA